MIINDNIKLESLAVSNLPAGGNIGTAANTVDQVSMFTVAQTTANQALTLPTPTIASNHVAIVKNTGTVSFQIHGANVKVGEIAILIFQNGAWSSSSNPSTGNIISSVSNALPTDVLQVAGLFEFSMAASTDVRIRSISGNRNVYFSTESEYPGGSFSTSTAAPVALTSAFITADNNVHVAGERFTTTVQDINTNRIFKVTCWRFGAITGNWSGWAEEIGLATNQVLTANNGLTINNGIISQNPKQYALFTRNATFATAANTDIPWTTIIANIGSEITQAGANITITPSANRSYKIRFNAKHTSNALLAHIVDFRLKNPLAIAQIINGTSIPGLGFFGEGTSLFSVTNPAQEAGTGILEYVITTSTPITFSACIVNTNNTPILGSTGSNRYPTIEIESIN
jgi:hypothetical protein